MSSPVLTHLKAQRSINTPSIQQQRDLRSQDHSKQVQEPCFSRNLFTRSVAQVKPANNHPHRVMIPNPQRQVRLTRARLVLRCSLAPRQSSSCSRRCSIYLSFIYTLSRERLVRKLYVQDVGRKRETEGACVSAAHVGTRARRSLRGTGSRRGGAVEETMNCCCC